MAKPNSAALKATPLEETVSAPETTMALAPIRVGMHVLGTAVTDVRVMRAATALVQAGYAVTVVDVGNEENHQREEKIRDISLSHVTVSRAFLSTRFDKQIVVRAIQLFMRSTWRLLHTAADIYHAHDVSGLPACYIAGWLRRKPVIFEAHEMPLCDRPLSEMGRSRRLLHKILSVLLAYMIPGCAGVITVSPPIVEEIRCRYHVPEVALIRSVPEYRLVARSDRLRQRLGLKPEVRVVLYQGNLQPDRGLDKLISAAAFLEPDIMLVLMGKNMGTTQAQLETLIASQGVAELVRILPPVPYTELLDWTTSADIGLNVASPDYSLNVRYYLPNKLFEYLMAGIPVLTSPLEAMVEIIQTYDVGQVLSSLEPASIGETINRMLADPVELARKKSNALAAAKNDLHWEKESLRLIELYQGIGQKWLWRRLSGKRATPDKELHKVR